MSISLTEENTWKFWNLFTWC